MKVAIRYGAALVDADGHVTGHDAGATLVRRLLRVFPGAQLVGPGTRHCAGFDVIPLELIDGADTVVINMDVIDSLSTWQTLNANCDEPKIMNFVWWNTSQYTHPVQRAALALSCALFPTFANSERTANEVREIVSGWTIQASPSVSAGERALPLRARRDSNGTTGTSVTIRGAFRTVRD